MPYSIVEDYLKSKVETAFSGTKMQVYFDYAKYYDDLETDYSKITPGALIVYDGWSDLERFENSGTCWEHTYRIILNVIRDTTVNGKIITLRNSLNNDHLLVGSTYYFLKVIRGSWLPADKSKSAFEIIIGAIEGV